MNGTPDNQERAALIEFLGRHLRHTAWDGDQADGARRLGRVHITGIDRDTFDGQPCRTIRFAYEVIIQDDQGARVRTVNAFARLPGDELRVLFERTLDHTEELMCTDVPDISDLMDLVID